jgi:hypothetical protein
VRHQEHVGQPPVFRMDVRFISSRLIFWPLQ